MTEVTDYITGLDEPARTRVGRYFARAAALVPSAEEGRSYGMAALRYRGRGLVSVVATKKGYSLFPFSGSVVARVAGELAGFDVTKGGIRFTETQPIPEEVFDRILFERCAEIDAALEPSGQQTGRRP